MRPNPALTVSAFPSDIVCFLVNTYTFRTFQNNCQTSIAKHFTPPADRQNGNIGSYQHRRRQADTASVPHSAFNQQQSAQSWCCGSVAPSHDLVLSPLPSSRRPEKRIRSFALLPISTTGFAHRISWCRLIVPRRLSTRGEAIAPCPIAASLLSEGLG